MSAPEFRPCLVIPNFNHGYAAESLVSALEPLALPLVFIDDGSTDETPAVLDNLATRFPWVTVVHRGANGGKGAAIRDGALWADAHGYSHAVCIDADGQHDIRDLPRFLEAARGAPESLILGAPQFGEDAPVVRRLGRELSNALVAVQTWSFRVRDVLCGFRVYPLSRLVPILHAQPHEQRMGFDVEMVVRLVWEGVNVVNIPTKVTYPVGGVSHFRYGSDNVDLAVLHGKLVIGGIFHQARRLWRSLLSPLHDCTRSPQARLWFSIPERGTQRGLRILLTVLEHLGRGPLTVILVPVMAYMFLAAGSARRAAVGFQRRVMQTRGEPVSRRLAYCRAWRQFWEFGISLVGKVVCWRSGGIAGRFEWSGAEDVHALLRENRGVVCMSAHVGHVEVMRARGETHAVMVNALMFTKHAQGFQRFMEEVNPNSSLRVWEVSEVDASLVFKLQECLQRGEIVAILADRMTAHAPGKGVDLPFLGDAARFPEGPWILASLLQAPVFFVSCVREPGGVYRVVFEKIADCITLPRATRNEALAQYVRIFAEKLAAVVCRHPEQWFNFFDFWGSSVRDAGGNSVVTE